MTTPVDHLSSSPAVLIKTADKDATLLAILLDVDVIASENYTWHHAVNEFIVMIDISKQCKLYPEPIKHYKLKCASLTRYTLHVSDNGGEPLVFNAMLAAGRMSNEDPDAPLRLYFKV